MPGATFGIIVAILAFGLVGCQQASQVGVEPSRGTWHVQERVGDIRASTEEGRESVRLRPGETIAGDRVITTGRGALLILSTDGVQLTLGQETTLRLTHPSRGDLFLEQGSMRLRLAKAVNREARIQTPHADLSASSAMLSLRTWLDKTALTVVAGNVVLATTDGRHRANLFAGAEATIDQASGGGLLLLPNGSEATADAEPLSQSIPDEHARGATVFSADDRSNGASGPVARPDRQDAEVSVSPGQTVIRPASRLKDPPGHREGDAASTGRADLKAMPVLARPVEAVSPLTVESVRIDHDVLPEPQGEPSHHAEPSETSSGMAGPIDPLQLQFDLLTEGLVDQL